MPEKMVDIDTSGNPVDVDIKEEQKQEALEAQVVRKKGGTGRRSLLTSSGGGIGYFNKYTGKIL